MEVERETDEGVGGSSRHARGCLGHFFDQCRVAARSAGKRPGGHRKEVWVLVAQRCQTEEPDPLLGGVKGALLGFAARGAKITPCLRQIPGSCVENEPGGAGCRQDPDQPRES